MRELDIWRLMDAIAGGADARGSLAHTVFVHETLRHDQPSPAVQDGLSGTRTPSLDLGMVAWHVEVQ